MQVVKMNSVAKESFEGSLFTGPEVSLQVLLPDSKEFNVNIVNFGKGVRNKFHAHDREQVLIVTSGKGYIATDTEKIEITPGDGGLSQLSATAKLGLIIIGYSLFEQEHYTA